MSYDLIVWAGDMPSDNEAAAEEFERRADEMEEDVEDLAPPSPALRAFLADLLDRFPALGSPHDENSPWATGPEPGDFSGDFAHINMTYSGAEEAAEFVAQIARRHHLVCFDPQSGSLL